MAKRVASKKKPAGRYVIREVEPRDVDGLYALSKHLDSVNFPHDKKVLKRVVNGARRSFTGKIEDPFRRHYMFVMEDAGSGHVAGTSMIFAQHGHPESPHIFFDVMEDERYSTTLDRHFRHITLRLGFNYEGPSEIGALVLDPKLRANGLGKPLSFVRFVFMAMYRRNFRDSVISELMPPLLEDGRSRLWEHLGRRFTGLDYQEADKLSHTNKEFIISLFPHTIHASLLPDDVRALIGEVGDDTKPVRRMLEKVGFAYTDRIDPFDGGPHFEAEVDQITVVKGTRRFAVSPNAIDEAEEAAVLSRKRVDRVDRRLICVGSPKPPFKFRAVLGGARVEGGELVLTKETKRLLRVQTGSDVWSAVV